MFFAACKKEAKKPNYTVTLEKIDGGDTLSEKKPFIMWKLNKDPLPGAYSVFKMAIVNDTETPMQAIERHGKPTKIANGSTYQYVQGYPLFEKGHRYAYQVDVSPGTGQPLVSSEVFTAIAPAYDFLLISDLLAVNMFENVNIYLNQTDGTINVDVSWIDPSYDHNNVKIEIKEVQCCHFIAIDPEWVGPNGEWPWRNANGTNKSGGHWIGSGVPVCQWETEKSRRDVFLDATVPVIYTTTASILAWTPINGNSTIATGVPYDAGKCYVMQITDVTNGWVNTFYLTGLQ
jgi:hypothetical protein